MGVCRFHLHRREGRPESRKESGLLAANLFVTSLSVVEEYWFKAELGFLGPSCMLESVKTMIVSDTGHDMMFMAERRNILLRRRTASCQTPEAGFSRGSASLRLCTRLPYQEFVVCLLRTALSRPRLRILACGI